MTSKRTGKHQQRKSSGGPAATAPRIADYQIYVGLLLILALAVFFTFLVVGGHLGPIVFGYTIGLAVLINLSAYRACAGRALAPWQQALARIPLRFAGYGTKHGRPLAAAHDAPAARRALLASIIVSLIILAGLAVLLLPGILESFSA